MLRSIRTLSGHKDSIYSIKFSPDGQRLASASRDGTAIVWGVNKGEILHKLLHRHLVVKVAFSPDSKQLATCCRDGTVTVWSVESGSQLLTIQAPQSECVVFSPDNTALLIGAYGQVLCWDRKYNHLVHTLPIPSSDTCLSLDFSPDGKTLAVATNGGIVVFFNSDPWSVSKGFQFTPTNGGTVYSCIFSPNGEFCAASLQSKQRGLVGRTLQQDRYEIALWNFGAGEDPDLSANLVGHAGWIGALDFSPTSDLLVSGSFDETICLWDPFYHSLIAQFHGHEGAVYGASFSPDGKVFATCSADGTVKLWSTEDVKKLPRFPQQDTSVLTNEYVEKTLLNANRYGRDSIVVVAQDILDGLLALKSRKAIEDTINDLLVSRIGSTLNGPVEPSREELEQWLEASKQGNFNSWESNPILKDDIGAQLEAAIKWLIQLRLEQAYREGKAELADFYDRFGLLVSQTIWEASELEAQKLSLDMQGRLLSDN